MSKHNLNCGCKQCHIYKHVGNKKSVQNRKQRIDDLNFQEELNDADVAQ